MSNRRLAQALVATSQGPLSSSIASCLEPIGVAPKQAATFRQMNVALLERVPDLIILADDLAGTTCWDACVRLREISSSVPLVVLCGDGESEHVAEAFRRGADEHVPPTVDMRLLQARVAALLRRGPWAGHGDSDEISAGLLKLDCRLGVCSFGGGEVQLSPKELKLLRALVVEPGRPFSHDQLIEIVWGSPYHANIDNLRKLVQRLRDSLQELRGLGAAIAAARGYGYYLAVEGSDDGET